MIKLSLPAKIHLMGEHAAVYGKPALLAAVNLRTYFKASAASRDVFFVNGQEAGYLDGLNRDIRLQISRRYGRRRVPNAEINITTQVPAGSGLGFSAAVCVGLTAVLLERMGLPWNYEEIYNIAYEGEKNFHGNPSGGDVAAVLYGGCVWFRKEAEYLKFRANLPLLAENEIGNFYLINSGKPRESTKEMIKEVSFRFSSRPNLAKNFLDSQERETKNLASALIKGDSKKIIIALNRGEKNLEAIGAAGRLARDIAAIVKKNKGAAKISGAGGIKTGSGMLLAYHDNPKIFKQLAEKNRWEVTKINLGEEGLKHEK